MLGRLTTCLVPCLYCPRMIINFTPMIRRRGGERAICIGTPWAEIEEMQAESSSPDHPKILSPSETVNAFEAMIEMNRQLELKEGNVPAPQTPRDAVARPLIYHLVGDSQNQ